MSDATPWSNPSLYRKMKNLEAENARIKAEVERLDNNCDYLDQKLDEEIDKSAMLCGQVERLRKAGDELERVLTSRSGSYEAGNASHEWQSAKNYKPKA